MSRINIVSDSDFAAASGAGADCAYPAEKVFIISAPYLDGSDILLSTPPSRVVTKIEIHYLCAMKYEIVQGYKAKAFRSVTGVTPETFSVMLDEVKSAYTKARRRCGRHHKLPLEGHAPHEA